MENWINSEVQIGAHFQLISMLLGKQARGQCNIRLRTNDHWQFRLQNRNWNRFGFVSFFNYLTKSHSIGISPYPTVSSSIQDDLRNVMLFNVYLSQRLYQNYIDVNLVFSRRHRVQSSKHQLRNGISLNKKKYKQFQQRSHCTIIANVERWTFFILNTAMSY